MAIVKRPQVENLRHNGLLLWRRIASCDHLARGDPAAPRARLAGRSPPHPAGQVAAAPRTRVTEEGWTVLPTDLREAEQLPEPICTPTTKAESGHDENITLSEAAEIVGEALLEEIDHCTLAIYRRAGE
jgi:hypothetical protein